MKIVIDGLSEKSLRDAAKSVDKYANQLMNKNREFVEALCEAGFKVISGDLRGAGDSEPPVPDVPQIKVNALSGDIVATLVLRGEDVMFVEFGAGVYYNGEAGQSPNPLGVKLGYTIGSYGKGHGKQPLWHYMSETSGHWKTSRGTEALMPMYKADIEIQQSFADIAKRVFGG